MISSSGGFVGWEIVGMHKTRSFIFSAIRTRPADLLARVATASEKDIQGLQVLSAARAESSGRRLYV
jgi:hypothetical protein